MLRLPCEKFTGLRNAFAGLRNGFPGMRHSYARLHGCIMLTPGCLMFTQGCIMLMRPWVMLMQGCILLMQGCVMLTQGCIENRQACMAVTQVHQRCIICNPEPSGQAILFCHKGGHICGCAVPSCIRGRPTRRVPREARWPSGTPQRLLHPVARHGRRMLPDGSNRVVAGSAAALVIGPTSAQTIAAGVAATGTAGLTGALAPACATCWTSLARSFTTIWWR